MNRQMMIIKEEDNKVNDKSVMNLKQWRDERMRYYFNEECKSTTTYRTVISYEFNSLSVTMTHEQTQWPMASSVTFKNGLILDN